MRVRQGSSGTESCRDHRRKRRKRQGGERDALNRPALWLVLSGLTLPGVAACDGGSEAGSAHVPGGAAARGAAVMDEFGCGGCHTIPGVNGASGMVGPPLASWSRRSYIAGNLPNTPENLIRWVMDPHMVEPGTAMPDVGLEEQQARDVAAYLYTLQ